MLSTSTMPTMVMKDAFRYPAADRIAVAYSARPQRCLEGEVRGIQGGLTQSREGAEGLLTPATYGPHFV